jgi:hypothetical protein
MVLGTKDGMFFNELIFIQIIAESPLGIKFACINLGGGDHGQPKSLIF